MCLLYFRKRMCMWIWGNWKLSGISGGLDFYKKKLKLFGVMLLLSNAKISLGDSYAILHVHFESNFVPGWLNY